MQVLPRAVAHSIDLGELTREFGFRVQENHDTSGVRLNVVCLDELQLAFDLLLGHYTMRITNSGLCEWSLLALPNL